MTPRDVIEGRAKWALVCADNADPSVGMASLADRIADHVITDPPYDERTHAGARTTDGAVLPIDFAPLSDLAHVAACLRATRRWVLCFCPLEMLGDYKKAAGDRYIRGGFWDRTDGTPQQTGDRPAQPGEGIAILHADGMRLRWNGGGTRGAWSCGVERDNRVHPTQKPLVLMERLIRELTEPNEIVIDPFAGSGTTGVAAIRTGRRFIGWERDPRHYDNAYKRLEAIREQPELFTRAARQKPKQEKLFQKVAP